ncbi:MAG: hypothetical protein J6V50_05235 [Clostridia bacterium]|nr:hypothetical protein [Clostridia bacterium]
MEREKLKSLIREGLKYIGFLKSDKDIDINIELLFEIRKYILTKDEEWYKEKFQNAYDFDIGNTRKKGEAYYSDDGIKYFFNGNMELEGVVLHGSEEKEPLKTTPIKFSFHFHKIKGGHFVYYYINEIDHFFTHAINNYLLEKGCGFVENGIKAIKETIEKANKTTKST